MAVYHIVGIQERGGHMTYEIQNKSDMLSGAVLIVKMPEGDLDRKALYTIQRDKPDFILPFRHRIVDDQIEFVYQIGTQCKLQYLAGERNPKEYTQLWAGALSPLVECGDWFLRPYSFVLDIKHLYCSKAGNSVSYIYVPSIRDCSDYCDLREMAADFSKQITVTDAQLENKVLRALMVDFKPKAFLQMLKTSTVLSDSELCVQVATTQCADYESKSLFVPEQVITKQDAAPLPELHIPQRTEDTAGDSGEIVIDISTDMKPVKKGKESKEEKGVSRQKEEKPQRSHKKRSGFFRKKKDAKREVDIGSDSVAQSVADGVPVRQEPKPFKYASQVYAPETADITQNISYETNGAWFRLVGNAALPQGIDIAIDEGEIFTVGRYDSAAGRQQSNFEFASKTKAVSRRHAAVERCSDGYSIIDLSSSAGTYFDGQKLPPNTPCKLQPGCRVSFGNCGADYVWEQ